MTAALRVPSLPLCMSRSAACSSSSVYALRPGMGILGFALYICLCRLGTFRDSGDGTWDGSRCCSEGGVSGCSGDFDDGGADDGADDDLLRSRGCSGPDGGNAITMGDSALGTGCDDAGDEAIGRGGCERYQWGKRTAGLGGG